MKCQICNKDFKILGRHIRSFHSLMPKEYYDKYLKKENEGICVVCGRQTLYSRNIKRGYHIFCSVNCGASYYGNLEEQKAIRKQNMIDYYSDENNREKVSIRMKRLLSIQSTKDKMSKSATRRIIKKHLEHPELIYSSHKTGYYFSKKNNCKIYYASSYEKQAFEILEQLEEVKYYNRCKFSIDYVNPNDLLMHKYVPDIEVVYKSGNRQIIEIKPIRLVEDKIILAKSNAAKEQFGDNFTIWTEKQLFG